MSAPSDAPVAAHAPLRRVVADAAGVAALASVLAVALYRIWDLGIRTPLVYSVDAVSGQALFKGMGEHGWWLHNPSLGAPFAQDMHDFPLGGENLHLVVVRLLMLFVSNQAVVINLYYLATFAMVAVSAFLVCRHLRFDRGISALVAIVYAFLPFHLWHGQMHIFRGAYFNVPPVVLLLLWMLEPTRSFRTADGAWRRGRLVFAAATAAMVAVTDTMTATFAVLLLGLTALLVAVRDRRPSRLLLPAAAVGVVLAVFLLSNIPTLLYASEHGKNRVAGARAPEESVYWGLKLSDMVLPPADYRIHALGAPARELAHTPVPSEGGQYLGLLGVLGFIGALYTLLARTLGRPTEPAPGSDQGEEEWALAGRLAVLTLLAVLIGTVHGLSAVIAGLGFTQVRVWNRIVVVIGFLVLLLLALGLERLTPWVRARVGGRGVAVLLVGLMGVALLDQAKVPHAYAAQKAEWASDARFGRAVQARLPKGTAVLQLPYMPFPESGPIERMQDYDPLKGYIHTEGLRWSYGALKGRPAGDWQSALRPARGPQLVMDACATGFEALWLDRFGYADPSVEQSLVFALGHPADVTSPNGRLLLFDVRDACDEARRTGGAQLSARAEALLPAQPYDAD